jgi:hypothetical protein
MQENKADKEHDGASHGGGSLAQGKHLRMKNLKSLILSPSIFMKTTELGIRMNMRRIAKSVFGRAKSSEVKVS